eukprot:RCo050264
MDLVTTVLSCSSVIAAPLVIITARSLWNLEHRQPQDCRSEKEKSACTYSLVCREDAASETCLDIYGQTDPSKPQGRMSPSRSLLPGKRDVGPAQLYLLFGWLAFLFLSYAVLRVAAESMGLRRHPKVALNHLQDFGYLVTAGVSLWTLGSISRHIEHWRFFLCSFSGFLVAYGAMHELVPRGSFTLQFPPQVGTMAGLVAMLSLAVLVFAHHFAVALGVGRGFLAVYGGALAVVVLAHLTGGLMTGVHVHLHHYHWSFVLAHFLCFPTAASRLAQAYCLGFFLHGVALYGAEPVFTTGM